MKNIGNQWKPNKLMEIYEMEVKENQWKWLESYESLWKLLQVKENPQTTMYLLRLPVGATFAGWWQRFPVVYTFASVGLF